MLSSPLFPVHVPVLGLYFPNRKFPHCSSIHGPTCPNQYMSGQFLSRYVLSSPPVDPSMASMSGMLRCMMMKEENGRLVTRFTYCMTPWLRDIMSSCTRAMAQGHNVSVLSHGASVLLRYE